MGGCLRQVKQRQAGRQPCGQACWRISEQRRASVCGRATDCHRSARQHDQEPDTGRTASSSTVISTSADACTTAAAARRAASLQACGSAHCDPEALPRQLSRLRPRPAAPQARSRAPPLLPASGQAAGHAEAAGQLHALPGCRWLRRPRAARRHAGRHRRRYCTGRHWERCC